MSKREKTRRKPFNRPNKRITVGVVYRKLDNVELVKVVGKRVEQAFGLFGQERVQLMTDCLLATFLANPVASARTTDARLRSIVQARDLVRG